MVMELTIEAKTEFREWDWEVVNEREEEKKVEDDEDKYDGVLAAAGGKDKASDAICHLKQPLWIQAEY